MRFMMIVKSAERSGPPPKALMDAIAKLSDDAAQAGTMIGGGGLGPTALGARVRLSVWRHVREGIIGSGQITLLDRAFRTRSRLCLRQYRR